MDENTRPPGKTTISPDVILTIARLTTLEVEGVSRLCSVPPRVDQFFKKNRTEGVYLDIVDNVVNTDIYVVMKNDVNIREVSKNIQKAVSRAISKMVGMEVGQVNIHIEDIDFDNEDDSKEA